MTFSVSTFYSHINSKEGLARPCRYEVIIPLPTYIDSFVGQSLLEQITNLPNNIIADVSSLFGGGGGTANPSVTRYLALQCENAELPGKSLLTQESKIYGPTFKVPYQTQFQETTLTFMCTNDFYERKLFERWIYAIMPLDTNNLRYQRDQQTRYTTNIKVIQYDEFIKQIFALELLDAYPVSIAAQPLSWGDDGYHKLSVQFAFQKYNVLYQGSYDLATAALEIFGSGLTHTFDKALGGITGSTGQIFSKIF